MSAGPAAINSSDLLEAARVSKAWPFEEARKLVARLEKSGETNPEVLFETGYGPSGLPHIGTFGEVARTTMVRRAFELLMPGVKTRLLCFSDDMDGMRKIPDNVPDRAFLEPYLHMPLTSVPDPFTNEYPSFGHHNNAMLRRFLDTFGFEYDFASATEYYKSGRLDPILKRVAECYDEIMAIMLPTLGPERRATYSPFLPISPKTGRVLYVPLKKVDAAAGTITFDDEDGEETTLPVTGGHVKLQWKPDFGARWAALGVDFEMFGKDHGPNMGVYDSICKALGGRPPEHFVYELFLDDKGEKISKSKGNGLTIDEWLTYAPTESLALYMFQRPRQAKKLYFDVIPRAVDEYYQHLAAYPRQDWKERLGNPVWHIHGGNPPEIELPVSFALLLNLVSASHAHDKDVLWGFISAHVPGVTPENHPELDRLVAYAIRYFDDFVKPAKVFRAPDEVEVAALETLSEKLGTLAPDADGATIQNALLDVARAIERYQDHTKKSPEGGPGVSVAFFQMIYQVLLGQERGPRFGSFVALYGIDNTRALIGRVLAGEDLSQG
ncbi:lysine--tRNA ligase [Parvibaculum sp.]|uniref:lysine--tRNA ligase n=1 Tax=Parvibaculum sp. TaxID=2024848 RepID=UPI001B17E886|nr:lysine--tRNA ligase [Parvibaculum sp.]MBO6635137.1 lysine--tRNA ligase [Parvibaculum sp.]MBO6678092.1 lysine--tRNA ligase [Parvibaculum sp.]MBO6684598.1 lysine--tRNA ligase [Parvibaculum sp.]